MKDLKRLVDVAMGRKQAQLCIRNAKVVDVHTLEVLEKDVLIDNGIFAGFREPDKGMAETVYDAKGRYMVPGFIDGHVHIESSHCGPQVFSDLVVRKGTTTVIADPHEICNCSGLDGLDWMIENSKGLPLSIYYMVPSCVPATAFEHAGATMLADDIAKRIDNERVLGLGEMMNYPGVLAADPMVLDKIAVAHKAGKLIDGHAPSLEGIGLDAYAAMGIRDDHECTTVEEARERLRRGMYVLVRQGTVCQDELRLLPAVTMANFRHCLFCTDDRQVASLLEEGSINNNVRLAVAHGFDPLMAISMATINSAECFRLSDRGAIDPGLRADFSLVDNLKDFKIHRVYVEGRLVAEGEQMLEPATPGEVGDKVLCNINIGSFSKGKLVLPLSQGHVRTIRLKEGGVVTEAGEASVKVVDGHFVHDPTLDVVKVCVLERHHGTGNIGLALLEGYGIKRGAVATTVAHDSHNIICCGCNDDDMYLAIETLKENHGGMVAVEGGKVLGKLSHPIAGLMSNRKASEVAESLKELGNLAWERLGVSKQYDPFMTLCFMALPVIPVYKVTDLGLFDVSKFSLVDIEIKD